MKILVTIKSIPDNSVHVKIKNDGSGIDCQGVKWIINPFDEIAVEEAVRLQEAGVVGEIVVVCIGPKTAAKELRYAMAMGADRAILVEKDDYVDSDLVSRILEAVYKRDKYDFILMGKQSTDSDANQTAQLLAARLNLPQACFASKIEIEGKSATVTREIDGGLETMRVSLPAVISADLRLNEPRYAAILGIMKAKKKPMEELSPGDLGVSSEVKIKILKMSSPPKRSTGRRVESVAELVQELHVDAKVI
jgi:electron transfer flavoprotein beta subunit